MLTQENKIPKTHQMPAVYIECGGGAGTTWSALFFDRVEKRRKALVSHIERAGARDISKALWCN